MRHLLLAGLLALPHAAQAALETFDGATWGNHEELVNPVLTDDLVITASPAARIKGVTGPNALYPGFDPDSPASAVVIEPRNSAYLNLQAIGAMDLFQMPEPRLRVTGFRNGEVIASSEIGPFWDSTNSTGTVSVLSGFDKVDRVELHSAVPEGDTSDVFLFIDSIAYETTDEAPADERPPFIPDDDDDNDWLGGTPALWLVAFLLLADRRRSWRMPA